MHLGRWRWLAASLATACASCTLVNDYPVSAELCTGGIDEDLDGAGDCADGDRDGRCPEGGSEACRTERDDDGDGLPDADDPRCWPELPITLTSCRTIAGSLFDLARNEAFWSADHLYYYPDPRGSGRDVLGVGGRD